MEEIRKELFDELAKQYRNFILTEKLPIDA